MARILLDMDGVLTNLIEKWLRVYNEENGDALRLEDLSEWGPHRFARAGRAVYKYLSRPGFFRDLEPIPGAVEGVRRLVEAGHDVVIVTAAKNGHSDKAAWVRERLPFLPEENLVFTHRKELVRGDVLFDDAPRNLEAFRPYGLPVAMDYPYNRAVECERVSSWKEFLSLIERRFPPGRGAEAAGEEGGADGAGRGAALHAPGASYKLLLMSRSKPHGKEGSALAVTEEQVKEALATVTDPELGFNIVDLGLVYGIKIDGSTVHVDMTLTSMGCPAGPQMIHMAREAVRAIEGVKEANVNLVFSPPWSPDMMREELKWIFGRG